MTIYLPKLQEQAQAKLKPPRTLSGSEWAREYAWFSTEDSATKERYTSEQFPYQPDIIDAMCDPYTEKAVVMMHSQGGKTVMLRIAQGYAMSEDPGPIMMIQPSELMAKSFSRDRLAPFLRDSPILNGLIADPKSSIRQWCGQNEECPSLPSRRF